MKRVKNEYNKPNMNPISSPTFETQYKRLNPKQKEAVDAIDGPVMVIAGPGTGKTSILTLRIANILKRTDTRPENILALTFTESGVQSMRAKLIDIMGPTAYKASIFTFHGFANFIIKKYPDEFPRIISSQNISEVTQINILEKIIDQNNFQFIKPYGDPHYYVLSILASIRHLKREKISTKDFRNWIEKQKKDYENIEDLKYQSGAYQGKIKGKYKNLEKDIKKNEELVKVYELYEKELNKQNSYDFEDMLLELIKTLESNGDFLLTLQEEYQYILADEHQDANNSQNTILELLSSFHKSPNLFIVGDEKQAIFRFQGASLENFLYFKSLYPDVKLIALEENYRSTRSILDASHELIGQNVGSKDLRVRLRSQNKFPEEPITLLEFDNLDQEKQFLVEEIQKIIKSGVEPNQIAVLYRKNREADALMSAFSAAGIPFSIYSDRNMLEDFNVRKFLLILQAINNPAQDVLLSEISFFTIFDLPITSIYQALKEAKEKRISIIEAFRKESILNSFVKEILSLSTFSKNNDLISFFEKLLKTKKWSAELTKSKKPLSNLASFDAFLNEVKKFAEADRSKKLSDFLDYIKTIEKYKIKISPSEKKDNANNIALMTAHKSKGLEFEYVFITNATEKNWGNTKDLNKFALPLISLNTLDDDRRLFYVAMTRAKKQAYISWSNTIENKENVLPSQFILEMKEQFTQKKEIKVSLPARLKTFASREENLLDKNYLRKVFLNQTFSVTAFNNYLNCPWKYFFKNLIRLPQLQTKHQLYGTAVHNTLKRVFNLLFKNKKVDKESVIKIFEYELSSLPISKNDFEDSLKKGKMALEGYFEKYNQSWNKHVLVEYNLSGVQVPIPDTSEIINLRGIIDKIELSKEMPFESQNVHVVDYKTRKPLTRNEIEGKTKNSTGDYKRQLVFYKFLLQCQCQWGPLTSSDLSMGPIDPTITMYEMVSGEIDFIEPDEKGNYRKEKFEITDQEITELRELLNQTLSEIYSFDFFENGCNEENCEECKLAKLILDM